MAESFKKKLLNNYNRSSRNSEEWLQDLPSELIPSIVNKLPLKSLCRFKCVSKTWLSMIIHESFTKKRRPIFGVVKELGSTMRHVYSIDGTTGVATQIYASKYHYCFFRNSCSLFYFVNPRGGGLGVVNPLTKKVLALPMKKTPKIYFVAFGFDPLSNNYKMLTWGHGDPYCEIYALGDQSWREITTMTPPQECRKLSTRGVCIQGIIYWYQVKTNMIISFNLGDEKFRLFDGPQKMTQGCDQKPSKAQFFQAFEFEGRVGFTDDARYDSPSRTLNFWMLRNSCNTWVMIARITLPLNFITSSCLYSTRTGEVVIGSKDNDSGMILYLYNFIIQQFETLEILGILSQIRVTNYVPNAAILEDL